MKSNYTILAIETSLDDTCAAVVSDGRVLSNIVASQTAFHEEFGGTVPHIAKRKHLEWLEPTIKKALLQSRVISSRDLNNHDPGMFYPGIGLDAIAVTYGPGLAPCLEVGIETAVKLSREWQKPLIAVNHMEGHLLSSLAKNSQGKGGAKPDLPALGFIISGGHTELVLMRDFGEYELLGETLDDAAGEAYDKVARMLNLGYPGGPILSALAQKGNPLAFPFPEPMRLRKDLNFSFSGIKTAAMYKLRSVGNLNKQQTMDFAASFQAAVIKMLIRRFKRAIELYAPKSVLLGGGVVSNVVIRNETRKVSQKYGLKVHIPYNAKLITDNAAMIGVAGWYQARRGEFVKDLDALDRQPNLNFKSRE